jgi:uncharacterized protein (DUF1501 family)
MKRCDGQTRRDFIRVGGLTALGLGLGNFFSIERSLAAGNQTRAAAKSCILIWLDGGPSHLDTFDPKPDAPSEVRGPFASIPTNLPGIRLNEMLTRTAGMLDRVAIIRSMTSTLGEHNLGTQYLMTGYRPTPALEYPTIGATIAHVRAAQGVLPPYIAVPDLETRDRAPVGNGYLPASTSPFSLGSDPGRPDFKVRDLDFYEGLDLEHLDRRRQFVDALDNFSRAKDASATSGSDPDLERAYNLIASPDAKTAFDLSTEPAAVRERYGIDPRRGQANSNNIGQSCLLARRLVERGVGFVTVNNTGWDVHSDLLVYKGRSAGLPDEYALIPAFDRAFSALVGDLSDRGMLDETLVVAMGEFGRTPKINTQAGRDHWPNVFSVALAGGGVAGGQVIGSSDAFGEFPADRPVTPPDLAATIFTLLGINPKMELHTSDGRPIRVAPPGATVVSELIR